MIISTRFLFPCRLNNTFRRSCAVAALTAVLTATSSNHIPSTACAWTQPSLSTFLRSSLAVSAAFTSSSSRFVSSATSNNNMSDQPGKTCVAGITVAQIPCLSDNYGYLIHDESTGQTAAVDTPEAGPYLRELKSRGWTLTHIFNTHHHWDHTGANEELKALGNVRVYGPAAEKAKIPGIDVAVSHGDEIEFGGTKAQILDVGGHTAGHIAYYFPTEKKVFVGDSLFALGCGRMFEGTPEQFWKSLTVLRSLPDETLVYCAHEYTAANAKFALSVEPGNAELVQRAQQITAARANGKPTVPSLMGLEKRTNPFLRCDVSDEIRQKVGVSATDSDSAAFAKVRKAKDTFRG